MPPARRTLITRSVPARRTRPATRSDSLTPVVIANPDVEVLLERLDTVGQLVKIKDVSALSEFKAVLEAAKAILPTDLKARAKDLTPDPRIRPSMSAGYVVRLRGIIREHLIRLRKPS